MSLSACGCGQPTDGTAYVPFAFGDNFDGSTFLSRSGAVTGLADGAVGSISFWVKPSAFGTTEFVTTNSTLSFRVSKTSGDMWKVDLLDSTGGSLFSYQTVNAYSSSVWTNILASWNTNAAAGAKTGQLYINDVSDMSVNSDTAAAFNIHYADIDWSIGARADTGGSKYSGDLAEYWFTTTQIDFSVTANRRKFISATGHPVDLGSTGQMPTGTSAIIYQSIRSPSGVASDLLTNRGTGGNFVVSAGSLTLSATNP